jgi:hypothetical protein
LTQRFGEAANEAAELARDADEAESLIRSRANLGVHAVVLDRLIDHVNNMARITDELTEIRASSTIRSQGGFCDEKYPTLCTGDNNACRFLFPDRIGPEGGKRLRSLR